MNVAVCGVPFPPDQQDDEATYRCELFEGHEGDHRAWGVLETPGEACSWVFQWEVTVLGN